jgi:hypothetical protein
MKQDIEPRNNKGNYHGYQERYINNEIYIRANLKNGMNIGYHEYHPKKLTRYHYYQHQTNFYIS